MSHSNHFELCKTDLLAILSQHHETLISSMKTIYENKVSGNLSTQSRQNNILKKLKNAKLLNNIYPILIKPADATFQLKSKSKCSYCIKSAHVILVSVGSPSLSVLISGEGKITYVVELYRPRLSGRLLYTAIRPAINAGFYCEGHLIFKQPLSLIVECIDNIDSNDITVTKVTSESPKWDTISYPDTTHYPRTKAVLDDLFESSDMKEALTEATANLFKAALNDPMTE